MNVVPWLFSSAQMSPPIEDDYSTRLVHPMLAYSSGKCQPECVTVTSESLQETFTIFLPSKLQIILRTKKEKGTVAHHNGTLEVESDPGMGARFVITLPTNLP